MKKVLKYNVNEYTKKKKKKKSANEKFNSTLIK